MTGDDLFTDMGAAAEAAPSVASGLQPSIVRDGYKVLLYCEPNGPRVQVTLYELGVDGDDDSYCGAWVCASMAEARAKADELLTPPPADDDDD